MAGELDLERGEPLEDEAGKDKARDGGGGGGRSSRSQRRDRASIRERLSAIFERIAERLEGRGDDELAAMVRQDSRAMVGGLESLIRRVPGMATPILFGLGVLEPVLAFGRIAGLLRRRWADARWERHNAQEHEPEGEPETDETQAWPPQ